MSSIYCTECGTKLEYSGSNKPNFCFKCGGAIEGEAPAKEEKSQAAPKSPRLPGRQRKGTPRKISSSDGASEGTDYNYVPNVNGIEYDVDFGGSFGNTTNLVDLLNEQPQEKPQRKVKRKK